MKFKDMADGQKFEFAAACLIGKYSMELGPWCKVGKRTYQPWEVTHRLNGHTLTVGTVNVDVERY